jgi:hypothetical protein
MVMRFKEELIIEDPRNHPARTVETLRKLLASGSRVVSDPKRPDFYELEHGGEVYYIHVSPVTGKILLLATWTSDRAAAATESHCAA